MFSGVGGIIAMIALIAISVAGFVIGIRREIK